MKTTTVLKMYRIDGRIMGEGPVDYTSFFERAYDFFEKGNHFAPDIFHQMTVVSEVKRMGETLAFRFTSGTPGESMGFYNSTKHEETSFVVEDGFFDNPVWIFVHPHSRRLLHETRRGSIGVPRIERFFELLGKSLGMEDLVFDIDPMPQNDFADAILAFERIRYAEVSLNQPNPGWDDAEKALVGIADASSPFIIYVFHRGTRTKSKQIRWTDSSNCRQPRTWFACHKKCHHQRCKSNRGA